MSDAPSPFDLSVNASQRLAESWGVCGAMQTQAPGPVSSVRQPLRPLWKKKRFWLSSLIICLAGGTASVAWWRGQQVRIIVKNDGETTTFPIRLELDGEVYHVPPLAPEASHRWVLKHPANPSPLIFRSLGQDGRDLAWRGGLVPPEGGARLILHLTGEGTVELSESFSIWPILPGE